MMPVVGVKRLKRCSVKCKNSGLEKGSSKYNCGFYLPAANKRGRSLATVTTATDQDH